MQDQPILNTTITISGIEMKNNRITLLAQDGSKYSFFTTKKDGSNSSPYQQYLDMGITQGSTVYIGYVIDEYDTQYGRKQSNKVISFREANGNPVSSHPQAKTLSPGGSQSLRELSKDTNWDQIAVGKCQTAFLAAYLQAGNTFADAKLQVVQARKLAELVVYGTQQEELPTITQDDDPAGEHNPFVNDPEDIGDSIDF